MAAGVHKQPPDKSGRFHELGFCPLQPLLALCLGCSSAAQPVNSEIPHGPCSADPVLWGRLQQDRDLLPGARVTTGVSEGPAPCPCAAVTCLHLAA